MPGFTLWYKEEGEGKMILRETDQKFYNSITEYLESVGVSEHIRDEFVLTQEKNRCQSINEIYAVILRSLTNMSYRKSYEKYFGVKDVSRRTDCFGNCDPLEIYRRYYNNIKELGHKLTSNDSTIPLGDKSLVSRFTRGALDAAVFMINFENVEEFYDWADSFALYDEGASNQKDRMTQAALPLILSQEIRGIGFALACDVLREIGYLSFPKPDTHVKGILHGVGLVSTKNDYMCFRTAVRIADSNSIDPFYLDKLLWLIGGRKLQDGTKIAGSKKEFVEYANSRNK